MEEVDRNRKVAEDYVLGTSETLAGKQDRGLVDVAGNSEEALRNQEWRCRVGVLHLAFVADKELVKEHAQWQSPDLEAR